MSYRVHDYSIPLELLLTPGWAAGVIEQWEGVAGDFSGAYADGGTQELTGRQKRADNMKKLNVLIVEDEGVVAVNTKISLTALGYNVLPIAISATKAIELSQSHCPDVILMDIKLRGEKDGIDAAREIMREREVPVIFVSAFTDDNTMQRVNEVPHAGFLTKPVDEYAWKAAIDQAISDDDDSGGSVA